MNVLIINSFILMDNQNIVGRTGLEPVFAGSLPALFPERATPTHAVNLQHRTAVGMAGIEPTGFLTPNEAPYH